MPFDKAFDDVYKIGIKESCEAAGAYCERVDEQIFHERILDRIYNQIAKADVVIADMTGRNPNVFYEVGYAHALGKTTVLLTSKADDIPFDLKHFSHIVYGDSLSDLRTQLTKRVKWIVDNPPTPGEPLLKEEVEVFVKDKNLADGAVNIDWHTNYGPPTVSISLHNISFRTIEPGELKIGFITKNIHLKPQDEDEFQTIKLPDGRALHMFLDLPALLPDEYGSARIRFVHYANLDTADNLEVVIRLFTKRGTRDYTTVLKKVKAPA
jgi:nucleoside 2-deoxyribosyltransferase